MLIAAKYIGRAERLLISALCVTACAIHSTGCSPAKNSGADDKVTTLGTVEVTAKLLDTGGDFPPNDLYDYAHVMKYEVQQTHRGKTADKIIYVGQYNPLKPRASVADERSGAIGGDVTRFVAGDVHRMALVSPIDDHYMGGIVNRFPESEKTPIYWALWTNRVQ